MSRQIHLKYNIAWPHYRFFLLSTLLSPSCIVVEAHHFVDLQNNLPEAAMGDVMSTWILSFGRILQRMYETESVTLQYQNVPMFRAQVIEVKAY